MASKKKKILFRIDNLRVDYMKDGESFVAYVPALDLSTCGDTFEEAQKMADEAIRLFIEECIRMGTLDQVLESMGWRKRTQTREWVPPAFIAQRQHVVNLTV